MTHGQQIAFIDLEASGLGPKSWPIEIGWGFVDWPVRSVLIKPAPTWTLDAWEKAAERLHRISMPTLLQEGQPILETAMMLNAALGNAIVYSDAPNYDGFWLYRLYEAAGITANFTLNDFAQLIESLTDHPPAQLVSEAAKSCPHTHRAGQDVQHMIEIYRLAQQYSK
ncbi:MAG: hypothetical protein ACWA5L_03830 [bacterium]